MTAIGEADGPLSVGRQYDWLLRVSRRAKPCKGVCEWDTSVPPRYDPLRSHPLERPGCGLDGSVLSFRHNRRTATVQSRTPDRVG